MKLLLTVCAAFISIAALSQEKLVGKWEGKLAGPELPVVFNISYQAGKLETKMDSPAQNAYGIPCTTTVLIKDTLKIILEPLKAQFVGIIDNKNESISGKWSQSNQLFPLDLKKKP